MLLPETSTLGCFAEACARHAGFWAEQHTLMLNTALTTTGNPQQLLEEEAA